MARGRMYQFVNFGTGKYQRDGKEYPQAKIVMKPEEVDDLMREVNLLKQKDQNVMVAITWDESQRKPNAWGGESSRAGVSVFIPDPEKSQSRKPAEAQKK